MKLQFLCNNFIINGMVQKDISGIIMKWKKLMEKDDRDKIEELERKHRIMMLYNGVTTERFPQLRYLKYYQSQINNYDSYPDDNNNIIPSMIGVNEKAETFYSPSVKSYIRDTIKAFMLRRFIDDSEYRKYIDKKWARFIIHDQDRCEYIEDPLYKKYH